MCVGLARIRSIHICSPLRKRTSVAEVANERPPKPVGSSICFAPMEHMTAKKDDVPRFGRHEELRIFIGNLRKIVMTVVWITDSGYVVDIFNVCITKTIALFWRIYRFVLTACCKPHGAVVLVGVIDSYPCTTECI